MTIKKVVKTIKKLKQSDFIGTIILDIAFEDNYIDHKKSRTALFECQKCHTYYENTVKSEKKKQKAFCIKCHDLQKHTIFQPLIQDNFKAIILYDTEYITKKTYGLQNSNIQMQIMFRTIYK